MGSAFHATSNGMSVSLTSNLQSTTDRFQNKHISESWLEKRLICNDLRTSAVTSRETMIVVGQLLATFGVQHEHLLHAVGRYLRNLPIFECSDHKQDQDIKQTILLMLLKRMES